MAEGKNSFIAYCDWGDIFDELEDDEAGRLVKHLFDYVRDKNPTPIDKLTKMMFIQIQQSLKRDLVKYDKYIDKQKANGSKGGRPPKPKEPNPLEKNPNEPKKADSVSVTGSVSDILLEKETKEFLDFWNLYDKKKGKKEKVAKKFLGLSQEKQKLIMEYIPKYKISQPNSSFRMNPMTFLNNDGWLDELTPVENGESKPIKYEGTF